MGVTIGSLAAPVLMVAAVYITTHESTAPGWTSYVGVILGYISGLLASRYDLGFKSDTLKDDP